MKASVPVCLLFAIASSSPVLAQAQASQPATVPSTVSDRAHAVGLLREAGTIVSEFQPVQRSAALNALAGAWKPVAPQESLKTLRESFLAATNLPANRQDQAGPQQAEVVRLMAAQDLPAARELIGQMRPPADGDFITQQDWRAVAWDGLLQQSLAHDGLAPTVHLAKTMTDGLADTTAFDFLVGRASREDPQAARDLVSLAAQQFSRRPVTQERFFVFPKALIFLAAVDRPMARRLFETLPDAVPAPPSQSDAQTEAGKQRIAFRREAQRTLLGQAGRFDPELAQQWSRQWEAPASTEEADARTDQESQAGDEQPPDQADAHAQRMLRQAQRLSRKHPAQAKDLLDAGRNQASQTSDPALRADLYAGIARTEDRLNDPGAQGDLEAAMSAIAMAQRTAKDDESRRRLLNAEVNVMPIILRRLDPKQAEVRARQFDNPVVRFRALLLVAQRWQSTAGETQKNGANPDGR